MLILDSLDKSLMDSQELIWQKFHKKQQSQQLEM